jgi:hypothetical protein
MATTWELVRAAANPLNFNTSLEREDVPRFTLLALGLGVLLAIPGIALGIFLSHAEASVHAAVSPDSDYYLSFQKFFFAPAMYGLMIFFLGAYRAVTAYVPWLESGSRLAAPVRMLLLLVMILVPVAVVLWMLVARSMH